MPEPAEERCIDCRRIVSVVAVPGERCGICQTRRRLMTFADNPRPGTTRHWMGRWLNERGTIRPERNQ